MIKYLTFAACLLLTACQYLPFSQLTSTTTIGGNDAFLLGNNPHGSFTVSLKNLAETDIKIWRCPIDGGQHSPVQVKPNELISIRVEKNTALRIENASTKSVDVLLKVKGDTGLSMGYQNH
ncbi:hypothetical protein [Aquirufa sp. TARAVU-A1A]